MPTPRSTIAAVPPAIHGARDYVELQELDLEPDDVVDFSANSNPFGPHPAILQAVQKAVSRATLARYPDRDCLALRDALSVADEIPAGQILPGNGATELIHLIALTFVEPGSRHLVLSPTFGEYSRAIHLMGGKVYEYRPQTGDKLYPDIADVIPVLQRLQPDTIWLCNPNNPTGHYWTPKELAALYAVDSGQRFLWIIDEAYRHFVHPSPTPTPPEWSGGPNVIRLRSLTKDYSLAGLRLGYIVAHPRLIRLLQTAKAPWSVNTLVQIAGLAALQPEVIAWRRDSLTDLHHQAAILWRGLHSLGLDVAPTQTTFALVHVGNGRQFRHRLLRAGYLVRDCASFGLPAYIRLAAHRPEANQQLLRSLAIFGF